MDSKHGFTKSERAERRGMARWLWSTSAESLEGPGVAEDMRGAESHLDKLAVLAERLNEESPCSRARGSLV